MKTIAIIGGGAAGLAAAVAAGEASSRPREASSAAREIRVVVYEADERVGRSILATGNGRCNFSNRRIDPSRYHNADFAGRVLACFEQEARRRGVLHDDASSESENGIVGFFSDRGLWWRADGQGRLYPQANKASVVLDVLRRTAVAAGVEACTDAEVVHIDPPHQEGKPFTLRTKDGALARADAVIVACGGRISRKLLPESVVFRSQHPVLGPLATDTHFVRRLDRLRVRCALELYRKGCLLAREEGEALFRKYGISGIAAFDLSRFAQAGDELRIDFAPWADRSATEAFLHLRYERLSALCVTDEPLSCADMLCGAVLPPIAQVILEYMGLKEEEVFRQSCIRRLAEALKGFPLAIEGIGDASLCQVHRGGVDVSDIDAASLEVKGRPGLYVAGEALDVDGPCGGYNLHWAFASGLLAGWHAADIVQPL